MEAVSLLAAALAGGATVENVSVAVATPLTGTGLGLKLQVGAALPLTTGVMLHDRVTLPVYPLAGVTVTTAVDEAPAFTDAGVVVDEDESE